MNAVWIFQVGCEVIEDLAINGVGTLLTTTQSHSAGRVSLEGPVHDVQIMHVLFDDMVAGKPCEIEPVTDLPFHL